MSATRASTPGPGSGTIPGRRRRPAHRADRDAGHEAVGQALLISIGLAGMLAASKLAAVSTGGIIVVMNALR